MHTIPVAVGSQSPNPAGQGKEANTAREQMGLNLQLLTAQCTFMEQEPELPLLCSEAVQRDVWSTLHRLHSAKVNVL